MIIVSQDKEATVNFDNVEVLGIGNPLENNNGKFAIIANVISDNQYILGEYATEERAKEVLQEIINIFGAKGIKDCDYKTADLVMRLKRIAIYEMPEE